MTDIQKGDIVEVAEHRFYPVDSIEEINYNGEMRTLYRLMPAKNGDLFITMMVDKNQIKNVFRKVAD